MVVLCDTQAQLLRADASVFGQRFLQGHEEADCRVSGQNGGQCDLAADGGNFKSVAKVFDLWRRINKRVWNSHTFSLGFLNTSSGSHIGATKPVPFVARISLFVRTLNNMASPVPARMKPRKLGQRQLAMRSVEGPSGVMLRQRGGVPVRSGGNPAQSLSRVASALSAGRFHLNRPHFARPEHGRVGASSQL